MFWVFTSTSFPTPIYPASSKPDNFSFVICSPQKSRDKTSLHSSCWSGLHLSLHTLKYLRQVNTWFDPSDLSSTNYSVFKAIKIFSLNLYDLNSLVSCLEINPPPNVEILHVPYCYTYIEDGVITFDFREDFFLARLLQSNRFRNLRTIAVPVVPVDVHGSRPGTSTDTTIWKKNREMLEELEVFKSKRILLRKLELGELGE